MDMLKLRLETAATALWRVLCPILALAWRAVLAIGRDVKASLSRKTTWVTIILVFLMAWSGGYLVGAGRKAAIAKQHDETVRMLAVTRGQLDTVRRELLGAKTRAADLADELEAARKTAATVKTEPGPPPVRRTAAPRPKPKPVPAPAVSGWSWFSGR